MLDSKQLVVMKKVINYISQLFLLIVLIGLVSCDLEPEFYTEYDLEGNVDQKTLDGLMYGAYDSYQFNGAAGRNLVYAGDYSGDHIWNERGGLALQSVYFKDFNWDEQNPSWFVNDFFGKPYQAIADVNGILDIIETANVDDDIKKQYTAECRFMRAHMYDLLYSHFGTVPLKTSAADPKEMERADEADLLSFIQTELTEAAADLPVDNVRGRATQGGAYAILMKHYLNYKNWSKADEYADKIIDLDKYELYTAGNNPCRELFKVENEGVEKESIITFEVSVQFSNTANALMSHSYPDGNYDHTLDGEDYYADNKAISGTKNRAYDHFYYSFADGDLRREQLIRQWYDWRNWVGDNGLVTAAPNKIGIFKYWPDNNAVSWMQGHDFRVVRYADVLLSKAEALNEISGPVQEAIDLINEVRARANAPLLALSGFPTKESLRDAILDERGWEFYFEGKRREDLIRHGKFISSKRNHPVHPVPNAEEWRKLFPIPLEEILNNPLMVQNPGY
jgi:hypothetical protein